MKVVFKVPNEDFIKAHFSFVGFAFVLFVVYQRLQEGRLPYKPDEAALTYQFGSPQ